MTLHARDLTRMPADTAALGQRLLPERDRYRVIGDQLADVLRDEDFAALYEPTGRWAVSPSVLALVTLFQFAEQVPDRAAAELVVRRLDWKYALHLPLEDPGFDFTCLCAFRARLRTHQQTSLVFDTIVQRVRALGFLDTSRQQRTDSLAVLGAVRQLSALETVSETLRLALGALAAADPGWVAQEVPPSFGDQYAAPRSDYRLTEAQRHAARVQVGQDGNWLLGRLDEAGTQELRALEAVETLRTVWAQRFVVVAERVAVRTEPVAAPERIVTPHDPGVRVGQKRGKTWVGEKAHVSETAQTGAVNFLTDLTTSNASSGDQQALPEIRAHLAARGVTPQEQIVDSGYVSGPELAASAAAGIDLVGPPLPDTSPQEFKLRDFQIDRVRQHAACPGGKTSVKWSPRTDRDGTQAVNIQFAAADCAGCPLRPRCTESASGRSLHLREHDELVEARRVAARTPAFRATMRLRPGIESTLSELVRGYELRRHRYRGAAQRCLENLLKGAACNLFRLVRALLRRWDQEVAAA